MSNTEMARGPDAIAAKHRSDEMQTVDEAWEFWRPIICNDDGSINLEQLKLELCDAANFMGFAASVYDYATGGQCTKVNTLPSVVKALIDDHITKVCAEAGELTDEEILHCEQEAGAAATSRDDLTIRTVRAALAMR